MDTGVASPADTTEITILKQLDDAVKLGVDQKQTLQSKSFDQSVIDNKTKTEAQDDD